MGSRHRMCRLFWSLVCVWEGAMRLFLIRWWRGGSRSGGRRRKVMDGLVAVRCWLRDSQHRHVETRACWNIGRKEEEAGKCAAI